MAIRVNEKSSRTITFILKDNTGTPVPLSDLDSLTLTLYDLQNYTSGISPIRGIINARDGQNVLNANDVTVHATSGLVTWAMQPDDNTIETARRQIERHMAEFRFVVGTTELDYQLEIEVLNLRKAA